ncbi:hypothetical protein IQ254_10560 [Nodosilinea sp. LEGE 07088]|uniref:hypothetical protein n=1 Tax=Nodosilinea sp. LEGE 07088 TaxID=2777968 RepID=UPI00187FBF3E|nr:hypothetical protein [Nodosilinea sp. LEGE 07088]MBE9137651.1 hypothetical protein [Nodosilinea sp. LEGE 07088]
MSTAESIYELVKTLPEAEASLVLVFAEFIHQRALASSSAQTISNGARFQAVSLNTKGFKFNRDEANER